MTFSVKAWVEMDGTLGSILPKEMGGGWAKERIEFSVGERDAAVS